MKVNPAIRKQLSSFGQYNRSRSKKVFEKNGDIFFLDFSTNKIIQITNSVERESNPSFSFDEKKILFGTTGNMFSWEMGSGAFVQLTDFKKGVKKPDPKLSEQEKWLKADNLTYLQVLKERNTNRKLSEKNQKGDKPKRPKEIYLDDKSADNIQLAPDEKFVIYRLTKSGNARNTIVPNYVTESGFTEDISSRTNVGAAPSAQELFVYDIAKDTVLQVKTDLIEGIFSLPEFKKDYPIKEKKSGSSPSQSDKKESKPQPRSVVFQNLIWSEDGKNNVFSIRSVDNKDRWIMSLDQTTQKLKLIDHQHDDAWIGGPGTGGATNMGWINNQTVWFHSEESGYSHLYSVDVVSGKKAALTIGKYEVQQAQLSNDKKYFYVMMNEVHPGEKHFINSRLLGERLKNSRQ